MENIREKIQRKNMLAVNFRPDSQTIGSLNSVAVKRQVPASIRVHVYIVYTGDIYIYTLARTCRFTATELSDPSV